MAGYNLNKEHIRAALYADADSYDPPMNLKQQIDARLAWQNKKEVTMKKLSAKKIITAAALACALTGTVCMAAEKISGYYIASSSALTETTDFSDIAKLEKKADVSTGAQRTLNNGFAFASANIINTDETDAEGNTKNSFTEVEIEYKKDAKNISYCVKKGSRHFTEKELAGYQAIEADGITYYFNQSDYLFVPEDYEPTEEELAAEAAGDLFISFGSDVREEKVCTNLNWNTNGQGYSLLGMDLNMDADELLDMAKQLK